MSCYVTCICTSSDMQLTHEKVWAHHASTAASGAIVSKSAVAPSINWDPDTELEPTFVSGALVLDDLPDMLVERILTCLSWDERLRCEAVSCKWRLLLQVSCNASSGKQYFEPPNIMFIVKAIGMITLYTKITRQPARLFYQLPAEAIPSHVGA